MQAHTCVMFSVFHLVWQNLRNILGWVLTIWLLCSALHLLGQSQMMLCEYKVLQVYDICMQLIDKL